MRKEEEEEEDIIVIVGNEAHFLLPTFSTSNASSFRRHFCLGLRFHILAMVVLKTLKRSPVLIFKDRNHWKTRPDIHPPGDQLKRESWRKKLGNVHEVALVVIGWGN